MRYPRIIIKECVIVNLKPIDMDTVHKLEEKCYKIRHDLLTLVYNIGLGHLGGELSMVEVAVALYYRYMNFDVLDPHKPDRDRFVLSKGHAVKLCIPYSPTLAHIQWSI